jgi:hypothetical protein
VKPGTKSHGKVKRGRHDDLRRQPHGDLGVGSVEITAGAFAPFNDGAPWTVNVDEVVLTGALCVGFGNSADQGLSRSNQGQTFGTFTVSSSPNDGVEYPVDAYVSLSHELGDNDVALVHLKWEVHAGFVQHIGGYDMESIGNGTPLAQYGYGCTSLERRSRSHEAPAFVRLWRSDDQRMPRRLRRASLHRRTQRRARRERVRREHRRAQRTTFREKTWPATSSGSSIAASPVGDRRRRAATSGSASIIDVNVDADRRQLARSSARLYEDRITVGVDATHFDPLAVVPRERWRRSAAASSNAATRPRRSTSSETSTTPERSSRSRIHRRGDRRRNHGALPLTRPALACVVLHGWPPAAPW